MADSFAPGKSIIEFEILGEPASKANSRRLVTIKGRPAFIKSQKAIDYVKSFKEQCPVLPELIDFPVHVDIEIYYSSMRPDLDESVILDCMQGSIYVNDRQVWSRHAVRKIDRARPRARIHVSALEGLPGPDVPRRARSKGKDPQGG